MGHQDFGVQQPPRGRDSSSFFLSLPRRHLHRLPPLPPPRIAEPLPRHIPPGKRRPLPPPPRIDLPVGRRPVASLFPPGPFAQPQPVIGLACLGIHRAISLTPPASRPARAHHAGVPEYDLRRRPVPYLCCLHIVIVRNLPSHTHRPSPGPHCLLCRRRCTHGMPASPTIVASVRPC